MPFLRLNVKLSLLHACSGYQPLIIYAATAMTAKEEIEILASKRVIKKSSEIAGR